MNQTRIYHILVLKKFSKENFGEHFPKEIINLIIMADYVDIEIGCSDKFIYIKKNKHYIFDNKKKICVEDHIKNIKEFIFGYTYSYILSHDDKTKMYFFKKSEFKTYSKLRNLLSIDCGYRYTMYITSDGKLYATGRNIVGQLGLGYVSLYVSETKRVELFNVNKVFCFVENTFALTADGKCYAWGNNCNRQLGFSVCGHITTPCEVNLLHVISITSRNNRTCLLTSDKIIYTCGNNVDGLLGLGHNKTIYELQKLNLSDVISVKIGNNHTLALKENGKLYIWGHDCIDFYGNLYIPTEFTFHTKIKSIACASEYNMIVTIDNDIWIWGSYNLNFKSIRIDHIPKKIDI